MRREVDWLKIPPAVLQLLLPDQLYNVAVGFKVERVVFASSRNMHICSPIVIDNSCSESGSRYTGHLAIPKSELSLLLTRQGGSTSLRKGT